MANSKHFSRSAFQQVSTSADLIGVVGVVVLKHPGGNRVGRRLGAYGEALLA